MTPSRDNNLSVREKAERLAVFSGATIDLILADRIEQALLEEREKAIRECAEMINKGNAVQSFYGMGPERLREAILSLDKKETKKEGKKA